MESMTGFSKQTVHKGSLALNVQMRSLNARFLEVKVGLPSDLTFLEEEVRKKVKEQFVRGTIDISIFCKKESLDLPIKSLKKWINEYKANAKLLGVQDDLTMGKVLKKAGGEFKESLTSSEKALLMATVEKALKVLKKRRSLEGKELKAILLKDLSLVKVELASVKSFVKKHKVLITKEWADKFAKLKVEADPKRLEAEVALLLEKGDITEEINRTEIHIKEFVKILSDKSDLIGKKLDFFCQELAREANTIASKSKNAELTRLSVNLKSYVEKLRQQVQNIQ